MSLPGILGGFETLQKQFFHIFGSKENTGKKSDFFGKILDFSEKSAIFSDFSLIFPSQNRFQPNRKPIFHRKIGRKKRFFSPCVHDSLNIIMVVILQVLFQYFIIYMKWAHQGQESRLKSHSLVSCPLSAPRRGGGVGA